MQVLIAKSGHVCQGFVGEAVPAYTGEDLRQEFRDMMRVTIENHDSIKSITIDRKHLITL